MNPFLTIQLSIAGLDFLQKADCRQKRFLQKMFTVGPTNRHPNGKRVMLPSHKLYRKWQVSWKSWFLECPSKYEQIQKNQKRKKLVWTQFWIHFEEKNVLEWEEDSDSLIHDWWIMGDFMSQLCNILYHINIFKSHDNCESKILFYCENYFLRLRFGHLNIAIENKQNKKLVIMAHARSWGREGHDLKSTWAVQ